MRYIIRSTFIRHPANVGSWAGSTEDLRVGRHSALPIPFGGSDRGRVYFVDYYVNPIDVSIYMSLLWSTAGLNSIINCDVVGTPSFDTRTTVRWGISMVGNDWASQRTS